ncbi:spore cortex-lytic enzyme [Amphibacillus sp. Q70]|uniref:spore cortex-lytic enzyme n=1 Tax=Amphibacillus sp. Q70 TaxID=3453416 RepID=UPI003F86FB05
MKSMIVKCLITLTIITGISFNHWHESQAFSPQVIQHGATGEDVVELQARLQYLGFFNSQIDGVFGWGTYWALRNFQYEFGMEIDGLAGKEAKDKLVQNSDYDKEFVRKNIDAGNSFTHYGGMDLEDQVKQGSSKSQPKAEEAPQQQNQAESDQSTDQGTDQGTDQESQTADDQTSVTEAPIEPTSVNIPNGFSQNDIRLMAQAVYGEARGEPYEGQVAVAAVILNRIQSPIFPDTVSSVIYEPLAFTAVADGQIYLEPDETSQRAVLDAINGWDPTGEAIYYFNPDTATSNWIWSRPQIKRIGKHIFCY